MPSDLYEEGKRAVAKKQAKLKLKKQAKKQPVDSGPGRKQPGYPGTPLHNYEEQMPPAKFEDAVNARLNFLIGVYESQLKEKYGENWKAYRDPQYKQKLRIEARKRLERELRGQETDWYKKPKGGVEGYA